MNKQLNITKWTCQRLEVPRKVQLIAGDRLKLHYFSAQPFRFGDDRSGFLSFVLTGYEPEQTISRGERQAIRTNLDYLVRQRSITEHSSADLDEGSMRICIRFDVASELGFYDSAIKLCQKLFHMFDIVGRQEETGQYENLELDSVDYIYHENKWLTYKAFLFVLNGIADIDQLADEEEGYNIENEEMCL